MACSSPPAKVGRMGRSNHIRGMTQFFGDSAYSTRLAHSQTSRPWWWMIETPLRKAHKISFLSRSFPDRLSDRHLSTPRKFHLKFVTPLLWLCCIRSRSNMATSTTVDAPWHAAYPSPTNSAPQHITREELLAMLKTSTTDTAKDYVLVDLRRADHDV